MIFRIFRKLARKRVRRLKMQLLKRRYDAHVVRLAEDIKHRKLRVVFLVNDNSKWKTQSLYDLFKQSDKFEPIVVINIADWQLEHSLEERAKFVEDNVNFFKNRGMECQIAYDVTTGNALDLRMFKPDIVFYQQPYLYDEVYKPLRVSKYALTCYVPYYIPNYWVPKLYWWFNFHRSLYRYYQPNAEWAEELNKYAKDKVCEIVGIGHTMLDEFYLKKHTKSEEKYIIYAPHWSIKHPKNKNRENYSTFNRNYKEILAYAKMHPEFIWVFKPHPTLKRTLIKTGLMSANEVEEYYNEWAKIGLCCYDSNYVDLFRNSKLMITDCGSFLIEYFVTGKPLVHLISNSCKPKPVEFMQEIYDTFYKVKNNKELYKILDDLIINNNDYKKDYRQKVSEQQVWLNEYAAQNIIDELLMSLKGEQEK